MWNHENILTRYGFFESLNFKQIGKKLNKSDIFRENEDDFPGKKAKREGKNLERLAQRLDRGSSLCTCLQEKIELDL